MVGILEQRFAGTGVRVRQGDGEERGEVPGGDPRSEPYVDPRIAGRPPCTPRLGEDLRGRPDRSDEAVTVVGARIEEVIPYARRVQRGDLRPSAVAYVGEAGGTRPLGLQQGHPVPGPPVYPRADGHGQIRAERIMMSLEGGAG